jgi:hypothetical protein
MPNRIQLRRGTALEWTNANPILAEGEICVELDTEKFKIGNGILRWNDLAYASGPIGPIGNVGPQGATGPQGVPGPQITRLQDIPDINSATLATGSMLIYDSARTRWNTEKDLPQSSNIDAGEF